MAFTCFECIKEHDPNLVAVIDKPVGEHPDWPGVQVFLPRTANGEQVWGLSVGRCETCELERPCVNC